jgi:dihydroorotase
MTNVLFRQVRCLIDGLDRVADVFVADGQIEQIADHLAAWPDKTVAIDGAGKILTTGLVDMYSHSGEPGHEEQETLLSLLRSAQAGGFVRLAILPDTLPAIDNGAIVARLRELYHKATMQMMESIPQLDIWGALTQAGGAMADFQDLHESGVVGFGDSEPIDNLLLIRRLLEYLQPYEKPVMLWPLQRSLANGGIARQGSEALRLGLPSSPTDSETAALVAILEVVAAVGTPVHIMRVSTARSVWLIAAAQQQGLPVTASVTWLHLLGNTATLADYNPNWRLDPPLGNEVDRLALVQGVAKGVIGAIAIDHQAHSYEDKTVAFGSAPVGSIGLELALPVLWEKLVGTGQLTALQLLHALSHGPAHCLGVPPPQELILFDPGKSWVASANSLQSLSYNTAWLGRSIQGRVTMI